MTGTFTSSADRSASDLHKYPTTFLVLRKARFRLATEYQYIKELYNINSSKVKKLKDKQAGGAIPPPPEGRGLLALIMNFIYGAGTIVDYCKENSKVKEIPDKAIDALNRYLDSIAEDKKE